MKACLKGKAPALLDAYYSANTQASWGEFKSECQQGYKDVQNQLQQDQGNLCCYCEINTKHGAGIGKDDFRVEHFHPKSDNNQSEYNYALAWENMLGCCHGGSEMYVTDRVTRYISNHLERHSDVLKGESKWADEILNPLKIPAFPILFKANFRDGSIEVNEANCHEAGVDIAKANGCLRPDKLNLNSPQLKFRRKAILDALNKQLEEQLVAGNRIDNVINMLVESELKKNDKQHWPSFFTTIRSYFGNSAEEYLASINYIG